MTGAVRNDGTVGYWYRDGDRFCDDLRHDHYDRPLHGCGDVFASTLCCALLYGKESACAVRLAADFTLRCIRETVTDVPYHWYGLRFEAALSALTDMLAR